MYQSLESPGAWGKAVFAALNFYIIQAAALLSTHSGTLTPESVSVSQYKHRFPTEHLQWKSSVGSVLLSSMVTKISV